MKAVGKRRPPLWAVRGKLRQEGPEVKQEFQRRPDEETDQDSKAEAGPIQALNARRTGEIQRRGLERRGLGEET